jgi:N-acetylneuraminate synthase
VGLFLIAEIGINHNGDLKIAKQLIDEAQKAGFDAVKFQKRTIDKVYTQEFLDSPRESPWGTTQRAQKEGLEFNAEQYREIDKHCKKLGIEWFASAWDVDAQIFLRQFNCKYNKVASAMLGHWPLLKEIASEKKKTFISSGMSTLEEIDQVVELFRSMGCPFTLLHCNSTYPMKESDANLLCIPMLRERYRCEVGYSGHETSLIKVCVAAVTLGAVAIERHITLDRAMYGSDQAASISTHVLDDFVASVRAIPAILGSGVKEVTPEEQPIRKKLRVEVAPESPALPKHDSARRAVPRT